MSQINKFKFNGLHKILSLVQHISNVIKLSDPSKPVFKQRVIFNNVSSVRNLLTYNRLPTFKKSVTSVNYINYINYIYAEGVTILSTY